MKFEGVQLFHFDTLPNVSLFGALIGAGVLNILVRGHLIYFQIKNTPNSPLNLLVVHGQVKSPQ